MYIPKHFKIKEIFPPEILDKYVPLYGEEFVWSFMDERILRIADWLREGLGKPMTINDYSWGGRFSGRGYRSNLYTRRLYASQHLHGRAIDFIVDGMTVKEVHAWIDAHKDELPCSIWVENKKGMTWIHIDVRYSNKPKVYYFGV